MTVKLRLRQAADCEARRLLDCRAQSSAWCERPGIAVCRVRRRLGSGLPKMIAFVEVRLEDGCRKLLERELIALGLPATTPTVVAGLPKGTRQAVLSVADAEVQRHINSLVPYYRRMLARAAVRQRAIAELLEHHRLPVQAGLFDSRVQRHEEVRIRTLIAMSEQCAEQLRALESGTDNLSAPRLEIRFILDARRS